MGGVANNVWSVRVMGALAVGRLGAGSDADLAWETGLLQHLDRAGLAVPMPIPTTAGRLFADESGGGNLCGGRAARGRQPTGVAWPAHLRRLHRVTQDWRAAPWAGDRRPTSYAATRTRIDLAAMPPRASPDASEQRGRG